MPTLKLFEEVDGLFSRDQRVLRLHLDLSRLEHAGVEVVFYNLRDHPTAFTFGRESLPVIAVDDQVVSRGAFPDLQQLAGWARVAVEPAGGCGGNGCTCGG